MTMPQRDFLAGLLLLALGVAYGVLTAQLPERLVPNLPGPDFFPWLICGLCVLLASVLLITSGRILWSQGAGERVPGFFPWRPLTMLVWLALFIIVLPHAGFLVAGIPFITGLTVLYGARRPLTIGLVSVLVPVALYYLFNDGFQILLPTGSWV